MKHLVVPALLALSSPFALACPADAADASKSATAPATAKVAKAAAKAQPASKPADTTVAQARKATGT